MSADSVDAPGAAELMARLRLSLRWLVVAAGLIAFAVALLIAVRPSTAALLPIEAVISILGSDYVVVAVIGVVAVGCAATALVVRVRRGVTEARPPVVEGVQSASYPGTTVDRTNGQSLLADDAAADPRERLREAAVAATIAATDCTASDARQRVNDGEWTTDQVASALLADDPDDDPDNNDPNDNDHSAATSPTTGDPSAPSERTLSRTVSAITAVIQATDKADGRRREPTEDRR